MAEYSKLSRSILESNKVSPDDEAAFVRRLRHSLRTEYGMPVAAVRALDPNGVIEKWHEKHKNNLIGGA